MNPSTGSIEEIAWKLEALAQKLPKEAFWIRRAHETTEQIAHAGQAMGLSPADQLRLVQKTMQPKRRPVVLEMISKHPNVPPQIKAYFERIQAEPAPRSHVEWWALTDYLQRIQTQRG